MLSIIISKLKKQHLSCFNQYILSCTPACHDLSAQELDHDLAQ